ncbi:carbohydrate esterase family 5 protein [Bipolaris zeicola 26-R-13]|uniref:Cutinase n=1 Tax=Cochliobolus carbonum (strain 26-R-13) TaxID=930089 RepID=W6YHF0_COCC2|nr:carbohydrate esterase family 5 protein [Bipolaris zeicola 26-R-13]EUC30726.1 carbohydrate esterase family 5 protein [Bipolaris zeicola 26-R-13]
MKYHAAHILALASVAAAYPYPQELPSTTEPGAGSDTGAGIGTGGGSGFPGLGGGSGLGGGLTLPTSLPSLGGAAGSDTGIGTGGSSWMNWLSGLTGGLGGGSSAGSDEVAPPASPDTETPSTPATPATPAIPGGNSTGGSGGSGGNCKPQQASSGLLGGSENGVVDKNCCTDMTIVFARGTGEMGNVGTVSGPPMFKAIRSKLGADRVTVQGVDYPASAAGNVNLGGDGGEKMAALVKQAKSLCPNTKVIVSGYSQGAMVVHNAFNKGLSAEDVSGAVLFGDPLKRTAVGKLPTDKVKQFCGTADQICGGGGDGGATGSHISYGSSAEAAATFAIQAAGLA